MWSIAELAYAAGIIDGEGYITVYLNLNNGTGFNQFVGVMTTDYILVDWLQSRFGGRVFSRPPSKEFPHHKQRWEWRLSQREIDAFLPAIRPYLLIKGKHTDLMLEFRSTISSARKSPDIIAKRFEIHEQFSRINRARKMR